MRKSKARLAMAAALAVSGVGTAAWAQTVVFSDTLTNAGPTAESGTLAGTSGDTVTGSTSFGPEQWTGFYSANNTVINPASQQLIFANGTWPTTPVPGATAGYSGIAPGIATRTATGSNFSATDIGTDDGAYIGFGLPNNTGTITETSTIAFASNTTSDGTAWGAFGLLNTDPYSLATTAAPFDFISNTGGINAWLLVRPVLTVTNTTTGAADYAELFATGGTGKLVATLTAIPAADDGTWGLSHTVSLTFNPSTGALDATIDGTPILATPANVLTNGVTIPTTIGAIIGDRTNTSTVTATNASNAAFTNLSVTVGSATTNSTWNVIGSGDWNVATNWANQVVPNGAGAEADLTGAIPSGNTVYTNTADTVGILHFNNANEYVVSGAGNLTLQAASGPALVEVDQGTQKIDLPLTFASSTTLNVASGATLLIANPTTINSGAAVSQTGTGTVTYQSAVTVKGGGSLSFGSSTVGTSLTLQSGANASIAQTASSTVQFNSVNISSGATLDVGTGTLIVNYGSGTDPAATIRSELISGFNAKGNKWQGTGITSTAAALSPSTFALGYADGGNAVDVANTGVPAGEVEVKYTVAGDANLSGSVDLSDLVIVASDFGQSGDDWAEGDVNYDGNVDLSDLVIVASNFGASLSSVQAANFSGSFASEWQLALAEVHGADAAVPEPGVLGLGLLAGSSLLARRRRA
jgi:hypothetical protein